ncbi:MAG TPA: DUF1844 domain-containing protein, partial [Bryobacteraceae bacterium]|nr:DUF1844 domain-containing protein [Bryobacteraceae bacterium]
EELDETSFEMPLPPADFSFLISSLMFQAQLELGLLHLGEEKDRPEPNLPRAKHSIDLLGVLEQKTKGNLSIEEQRLLENGLTELRFRFVQVTDELKKPAKSAEEEDRPRIITADGGKGTKSV